MLGICFLLLPLQGMKYVDVILPLPLPGMFTYSVPEGMEGCVVLVNGCLCHWARVRSTLPWW